MSNRKIGNGFEQEFAEILSRHGYWVHIIAQRSEGQPADIIAVKNGRAYLIDCKVCSTKRGFDLSRIEENQLFAMRLWSKCGNGSAWFAIKTDDGIFMVDFDQLYLCGLSQSRLTNDDIALYGTPLGEEENAKHDDWEWLNGNS